MTIFKVKNTQVQGSVGTRVEGSLLFPWSRSPLPALARSPRTASGRASSTSSRPWGTTSRRTPSSRSPGPRGEWGQGHCSIYNVKNTLKWQYRVKNIFKWQYSVQVFSRVSSALLNLSLKKKIWSKNFILLFSIDLSSRVKMPGQVSKKLSR